MYSCSEFIQLAQAVMLNASADFGHFFELGGEVGSVLVRWPP
jgi:hypothetical protein